MNSESIIELNKVLVDNPLFKKDFSRIYDFYWKIKEVLEKNDLKFHELNDVIPTLIIHNQKVEISEGASVIQTQEKWVAQLTQISSYIEEDLFFDYKNQIFLNTNQHLSLETVKEILPLFADDYFDYLNVKQADILHFMLEHYEMSEKSLDKVLSKILPLGFNLNVFEKTNGMIGKSYLQKALLQKNLIPKLIQAGVPVVVREHQHNNLCHLIDVPVLDESRIALIDKIVSQDPETINEFDKKHINLVFSLFMKANQANQDRINKFIVKHDPRFTAAELAMFYHKIVKNKGLMDKYLENIAKLKLFNNPESIAIFEEIKAPIYNSIENDRERDWITNIFNTTQSHI